VTEVLPSPAGKLDAVVTFAGHAVVACGVPEAEVRAHLDASDVGSCMAPAFLAWLGERLGVRPGVLDVVVVAHGTGRPTGRLRPLSTAVDHPRLRRARRMRSELSAWTDPDSRAIVTLGRGLARRWEISIEVDRDHRAAGLGRQLIGDALGEVFAGEPVFAQIAAGNAISLRAFLAAGFKPIGSEVFFPRAPGSSAG
jgi:GNAT superfamily N-acetyltransferase